MKPLITAINAVLAAIVIASLTGCASIVSLAEGSSRKVPVTSTPSGAIVTVLDKSGKTVAVTNTPAVVKLKRSSGFFSAAKYTLRFESTGYYRSEVSVDAHLNGWYFGNILFGGLIGLVIVDPATGAMWRVPSGDVNRNLVSSSVKLSPEELKTAEAAANPPPKKEFKSVKETKGNRHD